jgi:hypothetical protein
VLPVKDFVAVCSGRKCPLIFEELFHDGEVVGIMILRNGGECRVGGCSFRYSGS